MENYNKAIMDYLSTYPDIKTFPFFNFSTESIGNTSIATNYGTTWVKRYQRDHGVKAYDFAIIYMGKQDSGTSDINAEEMFNAEKFMLWIEEQNKKKNFPVFDGARVLRIENLQNQPNFAGVSEAGNVAKYMMQIRVLYYI